MFRRSRRVAGIAVAVLATAPVAAGCAAGFGAQTNKPYQPVDGIATTAPNGLGVRNTFVLGPVPGRELPKGSDAPLFATFANESGKADTITSITTDGAQRVTLPAGGIKLAPGAVSPATAAPTAQLVLKGLTQPLRGGESIRLTLQFANGGTLVADAPVMARGGDYQTYSPAPAPAATPTPGRRAERGGAEATPTPTASEDAGSDNTGH